MTRLSIQEAQNRGIISRAEATAMKAASGNSRFQGKLIASNNAQVEKSPRYLCSLTGDMPQERLWVALVEEFGSIFTGGELAWELNNVVPRRYRLDMALPNYRLGIEADGWQYHGRFLSDFQRDREKRNLYAENGWLIISFYADQMLNHPGECVETVKNTLKHLHKGSAVVTRNNETFTTKLLSWSN